VTYTEQVQRLVDAARMLQDWCGPKCISFDKFKEKYPSECDFEAVFGKFSSALAPFEQKDGEVMLYQTLDETYATLAGGKKALWCKSHSPEWKATASIWGDTAAYHNLWGRDEHRLTSAESAAFLKAHPIPSDLLAQLTGKPVEQPFVDKWLGILVWQAGTSNITHRIWTGVQMLHVGGLNVFQLGYEKPEHMLNNPACAPYILLHGPAKSAVIESALRIKPDLFTKPAPKSAVDEARIALRNHLDNQCMPSEIDVAPVETLIRAIVRDEIGGAK
jgi:hypothetical protein